MLSRSSFPGCSTTCWGRTPARSHRDRRPPPPDPLSAAHTRHLQHCSTALSEDQEQRAAQGSPSDRVIYCNTAKPLIQRGLLAAYRFVIHRPTKSITMFTADFQWLAPKASHGLPCTVCCSTNTQLPSARPVDGGNHRYRKGDLGTNAIKVARPATWPRMERQSPQKIRDLRAKTLKQIRALHRYDP